MLLLLDRLLKGSRNTRGFALMRAVLFKLNLNLIFSAYCYVPCSTVTPPSSETRVAGLTS